MIFEDIANVMNARPVKEIMRKTGLTKNRVYSLRMGCTFHMDYELLFALQRMGYEVRVFAVGDPARRSRDGDGKRAVRGGEAMAAKRTNRTGSFRAAKRRARFCAANPKGGADDRPARFRRRRNATEREQGPGRERKPRVGKEEGPRFRGADYESPTAYFLSIKKVGKER